MEAKRDKGNGSGIEGIRESDGGTMDGNTNLHIGIDVGSTTVKLAILDDAHEVRYAVYQRHHADVRATIVVPL